MSFLSRSMKCKKKNTTNCYVSYNYVNTLGLFVIYSLSIHLRKYPGSKLFRSQIKYYLKISSTSFVVEPGGKNVGQMHY